MNGARTVIGRDLDGDGDIDAIATSANNDEVVWYENDGTGGMTRRVVDSDADAAYGAWTLDTDLDGDVDILTASRDDATVAIQQQVQVHVVEVSVAGTVAINSATLRATDGDDTAADLTFKLTSLPSSGEVRRNGVAVPLGGTFTQADVNQGRVAYAPPNAGPGTDSFGLQLTDPSGSPAPTARFDLTIN